MREAARRADISEATWRYAETGQRAVHGRMVPAKARPETVARAAKVVGLDPDDLLDALESEPAPSPAAPTERPRRSLRHTIVLTDELDEAERSAMLLALDTLLATRSSSDPSDHPQAHAE